MAKPVILAVDDPQVLRAVERDHRHRYARVRDPARRPTLDTLTGLSGDTHFTVMLPVALKKNGG
ncbi:MAG: hypothetical protein H0U55_17960 [Rubrobacteraceae bacterium]|nr:hypothetical protein [Rubrobacteraceae bacterium]